MELPFVFGVVNSPEVIVFTGRDPRRYQFAETVMDAWAAFARSGNPNASGVPMWPTYNGATRTTMELGPELRTMNDPLSAQRKLWGDTVPSVDQAWQLLQEN